MSQSPSPTILLSVIVSLVAVATFAAPPDDAAGRLRASATAAVEAAPSLAAARQRITVEAAQERAELAPGSPSLQVQREGLGGGFSHQPNSASYLRLVRELRYPWLIDEARAARDFNSRRAGAQTAAAETSLAAEAARRWLELAAATDRLKLIGDRRERLANAVRIQSTRLEVGEVSGSDLLQLRLELAAVETRYAAAATERDHLAGSLELLCGERCAPPEAGDLTALAYRPEVRSGKLPAAEVLGTSVRRQLLDNTVELERALRRIQRSEAWGRPEAEVEWEHVPALAGEPSFDALGLLVSVPLPVGAAGREARAAADASLRAAELDARAEADRLEQRFRSIAAAVRAARKQVERMDEVLTASQSAEHSLAEQFRLGVMTYLEYIDGLSRLNETRSAALDIRLDLLQAHVELFDLLGTQAPFAVTPAAEATQ